MSMPRSFLPLAALTLLSLACGDLDDEPDDPIEVRDAQVGWQAANHSVESAHGRFAADVSHGEEGEIAIACDGGGMLALSGRMNAGDDFVFTARFDGCVDDGVWIDGEVELVASVDVSIDIGGDDDDHAGAIVILDYSGRLDFEGRVEGTCIVDAELRAAALVFGDFAAAGVRAEGTLCGHAADDVIGVGVHD